MPTGTSSAGAPAGAGPGAATGAGLGALARTPTPRGPTAKALLQMAWDYPVYKAAEPERTDATTVRMRQALSREEALRFLAGDDPRPLLVVRECRVCNKTDDALLTPGTDNERTILLSRWFHCVKLPVDVLEKDHPFNALFPDTKSEHLFVAQRTGDGRIPLESATSRAELWTSMASVLATAYSKDPSGSLKDIQKVLERLDLLDRRIVDLEQRKDDLMEAQGKPDLAKIKKVEDEIARTRRELQTTQSEIEKLARVELKPTAPVPGR